jgi:virginiamycin B lyase
VIEGRRYKAPLWGLFALILSIGAPAMAQSLSLTLFSPPTVDSPKGLVAGPDNAIWFTEFGANKIGRVTATGVFAEYALPAASSGPYQIANGSDGALWFTEYENSTHQIGRITTAGAITEFTIPASSGVTPQALGLAAGSDGALWVTCPNTSQIARITTSGQVTTYALPASYSPGAIAPGPDGALWFLENATASAIGRITTAGVITQFPLPASSAGTLTALTAGPDGAVWFIDSAAQGVTLGRITGTGAMTFFPAPGAFSGLAAGPDGALWFVGGTLNIGRITTSGNLTTYRCNGQVIATSSSGACFPDQIVPGPNGTLWFSDPTRGYIVQGTPGGLSMTSLSPTTTAAAGTADIALTVNGTGFATGAGVAWNGTLLNTAFVNGGQLTATIPAGYLTAGTYTLNVVNPGQATSNSLTFTVTAASATSLAITTAAALPLGVVGSLYSQPLKAIGGTPPYQWSLASGSLPLGLSLSSGGNLTGIPSAPGTSSFTVNVTDSGSNTLSQSFNTTVFPAQAFSTSALRIPQVADGGGWNTRFAIMNLDSGPVSYTFQFWDDNGRPLALPVAGGAPGVISGNLAPGGVAYARTLGSASALQQGWAEIASTGRIAVTAMYQFAASGISGLETSAIATPSGSSVFVPFDNTGGHATAIALANSNSAQTLTISLQFLTDTGSRSTASIVLAPRAHLTFVVPQAYPAVSGARGSINFTASSPDIVVMGLWQGPAVLGGASYLGAFQ